jgi:hypothetical protein
MVCKSCQERREAVRRLTAKVGTIVFGRKRKGIFANFEESDGKARLNGSGETEAVAAAVSAATSDGSVGSDSGTSGSDGGI